MMTQTITTQTQSAAAWQGRPLAGVLFDLDGTLLDTAADIARALNRVFGEHGLAPVPVAEVARMIGRGSPMLIERATVARGLTFSDAEKAAMLERFFHHYGALEEADESDAGPYAGVGETLRLLHEARLRIAVVTNKHYRFASALLERLNLMQWIDVLVGGDTCERRKPDPQPLLFACQSLGVSPSAVLMVGDSINDVTAARAAGIPVVCVPYGYNEGRDPRTLACDAMIETLADLPGLFWPEGAATRKSAS
jgi:phosphoglycolate phosphatase